jgi:hypothetical protein
MLLVRCANGLVLWRLVQPVGDTQGYARCLNDAFVVPMADHTDTTLVAAIAMMASHSAAVGGAISWASDIGELT